MWSYSLLSVLKVRVIAFLASQIPGRFVIEKIISRKHVLDPLIGNIVCGDGIFVFSLCNYVSDVILTFKIVIFMAINL